MAATPNGTSWALHESVGNGNMAYANYPHFTRIAHNVDRASQVQIVTTIRAMPRPSTMSARAWRMHTKPPGIQVTSTETITRLREQNEFFFQDHRHADAGDGRADRGCGRLGLDRHHEHQRAWNALARSASCVRSAHPMALSAISC